MPVETFAQVTGFEVEEEEEEEVEEEEEEEVWLTF